MGDIIEYKDMTDFQLLIYISKLSEEIQKDFEE
jgi:hypothetical protein